MTSKIEFSQVNICASSEEICRICSAASAEEYYEQKR